MIMIAAGCTKLDEKLYSTLTPGNFYNNRTEVLSAVLRPFTHARAWATIQDRHGYWRLQELTADQQAWPQKGRHGYDGAQWFRQHYHQWTVTDRSIEEPWELIYAGIGFCNVTIRDLANVDFPAIGMTEAEKASFIAESKVIRAWHYLKLLDLYGNIPISTEVLENPVPTNPPTVPRPQVFDFVEAELLANVPLLPKLSRPLAGRVSRAAGYAMLSELYLNAEVWKGEERWEECIAASDSVILGAGGGLNGAPILDPDILTAFSNTNHLSRENIFQIAYDYKASGDAPQYPAVFYHYRQRQIYNGDRDGNNEFVTTPNGFDAYADNDLRKQQWFLFGPQYKYGTTDPVLGSEEYNGQPLVFVNSIRRNSEGETGEGGMSRGEENSGARFDKYRPGTLADQSYLGNDFVIYRLTEMYFNKAEALIRQNGGVATQEAVDLINASRQRAFLPADWPAAAYTTATLTMDELLAERGREFVFEGKRRSDMIRFGTFTTASWWDHEPSDPTKELFPIPQKQLAANPNLVQNPGY